MSDDLEDALDWMEDELKASLGSKKMTHDARDIETMARLLCDIQGTDPDDEVAPVKTPVVACPAWEEYTVEAARGLDYMQAKGWKMIGPEATEEMFSARSRGEFIRADDWQDMHAAATITPRDE